MINAIPTRYGGVTFRSRLEARWAVVFDHLGIRWQYEHEGYIGAYDTCYLPDFWLPDLSPPAGSPCWSERWTGPPVDGIHAEVKGSEAQLSRDLDKIEYAIDFLSTPVAAGLLILGPIPTGLSTHSFAYWHKGVEWCRVELFGSTLRQHDYSHAWYGCDLAYELLNPSPPLLEGRLKLGQRHALSAYVAARNERFGT